MTLPFAYLGVKKIFTAKILILAAFAMIFIGLIPWGVSHDFISPDGIDHAAIDNFLEDEVSLSGKDMLFAFSVFTGAMLLAVGMIIQLVGCVKAGRDESAFMTAFWLTIAAFASMLFFDLVLKAEDSVISDIVTDALTFAAEIFIVIGVINVSKELAYPEMVSFGKTLVVLFIILAAADMGLAIAKRFVFSWRGLDILKYFSVAANVLEAIVLIAELVYIGKAKKILAENWNNAE